MSAAGATLPASRATTPAVAILAGGLATRLYPLTETLPKSLLPVAGEPFLAHQLRGLAAQNFPNVVICAGHLGEQIEAYAGDGARFGCSVRYSFDGSRLLGTGGALRRALPLLGERFLVIYGDSYLMAPFRPVWEAFLSSRKTALMTVFRNDDQWGKSNVEFGDGRILRYDKLVSSAAMQHIDYGLECLRGDALRSWPEERFDLAAFCQAMLERDELAGFEVKERFYEIGSAQGLAETDALLTTRAAVHALPRARP